MNSQELQGLRSIIDAGHPVTGAFSTDDKLAKGEINEKNIVRVRESITGKDIFESTDSGEFAGLTDVKKQLWISFCGIAEHDPSTNGPAHEFVIFIFGVGSNTVAELVEVRKELVSLATDEGFSIIRTSEIRAARAL